MNISNLVDVASELIILLAAHLLKSFHRTHISDIASRSVDYDPKWKLPIQNDLSVLFENRYLGKNNKDVWPISV